MNMFTKIALSLPMIMATAAYADGMPNSQSLHQADAGMWEVTPQFAFASQKYNYGSGQSQVSSATNSLFGFDVTGEYGINQMISVGVRLGYQKDNYSFNGQGNAAVPNTKGDGMVDPDIFINLRNDLGAGILRYGANFSFALGDQNLGDTNSLNSYTGGMTFTPYVGYEYAFGRHELGARVSYDLIQTDRKWDDVINGVATNGKIKNGNEFTATVFYEFNVNPVVIGADIGLMSYNSTTSNFGNGDISNNNNYTAGKIDVYAAYTMAKDLVLMPAIGYNTLDTGSQFGRLFVAGTSGSGGLYGDLALRIGF